MIDVTQFPYHECTLCEGAKVLLRLSCGCATVDGDCPRCGGAGGYHLVPAQFGERLQEQLRCELEEILSQFVGLRNDEETRSRISAAMSAYAEQTPPYMVSEHE